MELRTIGNICLRDKYNIKYVISKIEYIEKENGDYKYLFYPNYSVIDMLNCDIFQGIPGIDLDKRKNCYERTNMTPVFISERSPGKNRVDLHELLEQVNMTSLNRLEWLIRTNTQYFGDNMYVEAFEERKIINIDSMFDLSRRTEVLIFRLLEIICSGNDLKSGEVIINDSNRKYYYDLLLPMFMNLYQIRKSLQREGIEKAKANNIYKGRTRKNVNPLAFNEVVTKYNNKEITAEEATNELNISKSTFYRRLKEKK